MISRIFAVVIFFLLSFLCNANHLGEKALRIFEEVNRLEERERLFLTEEFAQCDDSHLLDWYIYFCGEKDYRELPRLRAFYIEKVDCIESEMRGIFGSLDVQNFTTQQQKEFAESLNVMLHKYFFKKYKADADTFGEVVNHGYYNCVSSSVLYMLLLYHFGMKATPIQTKEHVFIVVHFPDATDIDVETTNAYGFDPGKKKEVLDELGKITGFSYVKQKNYKNRFNISLKTLLLLVLHNKSAYYTKVGKHEAALRLACFLRQVRNDERGESEFHICYYNLLATLSSTYDFETQLQLLYHYLENINAENVRIRKMRFHSLTQMILKADSESDFEKVQVFFDKEEKHCRVDEKNAFHDIENAFYVSKVQFYYKNNRIEDTFKAINDIADNKNKAILLRNTFAIINQNAIKTKDFDKAHDLLMMGKKMFSASKDFDKAMKTFWNNYLVSFTQKGIFAQALELLENESGELREEDKHELMKVIYNSYAYEEYKKEKSLNAARICAEAYKVLGKEKVIMENMKIYYLNAYKVAQMSKDSNRMLEIKNEASVYFPNFPE